MARQLDFARNSFYTLTLTPFFAVDFDEIIHWTLKVHSPKVQ